MALSIQVKPLDLRTTATFYHIVNKLTHFVMSHNVYVQHRQCDDRARVVSVLHNPNYSQSALSLNVSMNGVVMSLVKFIESCHSVSALDDIVCTIEWTTRTKRARRTTLPLTLWVPLSVWFPKEEVLLKHYLRAMEAAITFPLVLTLFVTLDFQEEVGMDIKEDPKETILPLPSPQSSPPMSPKKRKSRFTKTYSLRKRRRLGH